MKTLSRKGNITSGLLAILLSVLLALTFMPTIVHIGIGAEETFAEDESMGYAQVALGYNHSGAVDYPQVVLGNHANGVITSDGSLYMWHLWSDYHGAWENITKITLPERTKVKALSIGEYNYGAITEDGKLYMWGGGLIGDGTEEGSSIPKQITVPGDAKIKALALGNCLASSSTGGYGGIITEDGKLHMWGENYCGRIGDGTLYDSLIPKHIALPEGKEAKALSLGYSQSGAITEDGKLYMWGDNEYGQLGDGSTDESLTPKQIAVPGEARVKAVSLGEYHSGAITEDGRLYMWGGNWFGQLGDGTGEDNLSPKQIMMPGGAKVKALCLGSTFSGAITEDGKLYMWGSNYHGELGDGTTNSSQFPKEITMPDGDKVKSLSLAQSRYDSWHDQSSAAITESGKLYMWGIIDGVKHLAPKFIMDLAAGNISVEEIISVSNAQITCQSPLVYTGAALQPKVAVSYNGNLLKEGTDYRVSYENNVNAGTGSAVVEGLGNYTGKATTSFRIEKAANPLTAKGKTTKVKHSKLKKKTQALARTKAITVGNPQGIVTYQKISVGSKKINKKYGKKISINKTSGKITVRKGMKKGSYKVRVQVNATGNANYHAASRIVTFTVKIK